MFPLQGNRKMEEKAKERDNRLLLTLIGFLNKLAPNKQFLDKEIA